MHIGGSRTMTELIDAWQNATGECGIIAKQRVNTMRKAGVFRDFRKPAESRVTTKVVTDFLIGMLSADRHIDAADALAVRGALMRSRLSAGAHIADIMETDGTFRADVEALVCESSKPAKEQRWVVETISVSTTHPACGISLIDMRAPRRITVTYGEGEISDPSHVGQSRRISRTNQLQGSVLKYLSAVVD